MDGRRGGVAGAVEEGEVRGDRGLPVSSQLGFRVCSVCVELAFTSRPAQLVWLAFTIFTRVPWPSSIRYVAAPRTPALRAALKHMRARDLASIRVVQPSLAELRPSFLLSPLASAAPAPHFFPPFPRPPPRPLRPAPPLRPLARRRAPTAPPLSPSPAPPSPCPLPRTHCASRVPLHHPHFPPFPRPLFPLPFALPRAPVAPSARTLDGLSL